jgi:hypothetical protein
MQLPTLALCAIASLPLVAAADSKPAIKLTSETTPLYPSKRCKTVTPASDGGDPALRCPAKRGYQVDVSFSAWATHVEITGPSTQLSFEGYVGKQLEWRLAGGKPFAVIISVDEQGPGEDGSANPKAARLRVRGINGFMLDAGVQADAKDARKAAQEIADAAYRAHAK